MSTDITSRKQELTKAADIYRQNIETQVGEFKKDAVKVGKQALIIGGACVAVYLVVSAITSGSSKRKRKKLQTQPTASDEVVIVKAEKEEQEDSLLWSTLKGVALSLLLAAARKKLVDVIATLTEADAKENA